MTEEELNASFAKTAKKKAAQAAAHRKWRDSEKGKAYALKKKLAKYTKTNETPGSSSA